MDEGGKSILCDQKTSSCDSGRKIRWRQLEASPIPSSKCSMKYIYIHKQKDILQFLITFFDRISRSSLIISIHIQPLIRSALFN
jgi:hypothetical protein